MVEQQINTLRFQTIRSLNLNLDQISFLGPTRENLSAAVIMADAAYGNPTSVFVRNIVTTTTQNLYAQTETNFEALFNLNAALPDNGTYFNSDAASTIGGVTLLRDDAAAILAIVQAGFNPGLNAGKRALADDDMAAADDDMAMVVADGNDVDDSSKRARRLL